MNSFFGENSQRYKIGIYFIALLLYFSIGYLIQKDIITLLILLIAFLFFCLIGGYIIKKPQAGLYLVVVSFMFDSRNIPGPINISVSNVLLILTLIGVILAWHLSSRRSQIRLSKKPDKSSLLLGGGLLLGAVFSLLVAAYPDIVLRSIVTVIGGLILLLVTQILTTRDIDIERLLKIYTFGAVICALFGVIQSFLARFVDLQYGEIMWALGGPHNLRLLRFPRVTSTWLDPNIFGLFLIPAVIFSLIIPSKYWVKALLSAVLLGGIAVSYSRTAWISAAFSVVVSIGFYWLSRSYRKSGHPSTIGFRVWILLLIGLILVLSLPLEKFWDELININPDSYEGRLEMTHAGLKVYLESPIWGVGPGNLMKTKGAFTHNSYLGVLIEYGLIGGLAWFSLLFLTLWRGVKNIFRYTTPRLRKLSISLLSAFAGLLVGGLSIEIQNAKFLWFIIAIITILAMQCSNYANSYSRNQ